MQVGLSSSDMQMSISQWAYEGENAYFSQGLMHAGWHERLWLRAAGAGCFPISERQRFDTHTATEAKGGDILSHRDTSILAVPPGRVLRATLFPVAGHCRLAVFFADQLAARRRDVAAQGVPDRCR